MTLCTRCGIHEAPEGDSIEADPLCDQCIRDAIADARACPGWDDSCGNLRDPGADLCPDCTTARLDAQSPRIPR